MELINEVVTLENVKEIDTVRWHSKRTPYTGKIVRYTAFEFYVDWDSGSEIYYSYGTSSVFVDSFKLNSVWVSETYSIN